MASQTTQQAAAEQARRTPVGTINVVDDYKVRINFPEPDGLVLGKFRGMHVPSTRFWEEEGFGYRKNGTGEGHW